MSLRIHSRMPDDSNWKIEIVSPFWNSRYVSGSSSGTASRSIVTPWFSSMSASASSRIVSVLRPRKSILNRPKSSIYLPSYCVTTASAAPLLPRWIETGTYWLTSPGAMMTPAAWTPVCRAEPSRTVA